jgi:hypothetical protein
MNRSLKTLFLYQGIFVFAHYLIGPIFAVFVEGIGNSIINISIAISVALWSNTFFTYIISKYGDKVKEKEYLLMVGYLVRAIVWASYPFVRNFQSLILLQVLIGFGESFGVTSFSSIFAEHLDRGKYIREYGSWHWISNIIAGIATAMGGFIITAFGFSTLFFIMSGLAIISFFGILFKPRNLL